MKGLKEAHRGRKEECTSPFYMYVLYYVDVHRVKGFSK